MDRKQFQGMSIDEKLLYLFDATTGDSPQASAAAAAAAPPDGSSPEVGKTGFDLGTSNGNWLKNEFEGTNRFSFEVRDGQQRVEITLGVVHDMGGYKYRISVIKDDGTEVEASNGTGGNGIVKLLDFIPPTPQRGGGMGIPSTPQRGGGIGKAWPHGPGKFHIDLTVSQKQFYVMVYNHD